MFHLFKTVYLEYDYKFDGLGYNFIMASPLVGAGIGLPMGGPEEDNILYPVVNSFQDLLDKKFNGKIEKFWEKLYTHDNKLICYLLPEDFNRLQIQYWKSIFKNSDINDIYFLHKTWIESVRLRSYINTTAIDYRNYETRQKLNILSFDEFKTIYDSVPVSNYLINGIDISKVSFEYLLADFLYNGSSSAIKNELLNRVKLISLENWRDELEQLKLEIMFGFLDIDQVDKTLNLEVGNVENQLKNSSKLKWMCDEKFSTDIQYIKANYNYLDLVDQWKRIYEIWGGNEDMKEISDLIMAEKWEELLDRDIKRNFGCLYTFELFREKSNQIFATYCYKMKRQDKTNVLAGFKLD